MYIILIFRKRNPIFFSIERVFNIVIQALPKSSNVRTVILPRAGFSIKNILYLFGFSQKIDSKYIFHITGDVHYIIASLPGSRTILTIHDLIFLQQYTGLKRRVVRWLYLSMPIKKAKYITTISEKIKSEIIHFTKCPADKIVVIPNPINPLIHFRFKPFSDEIPKILVIGATPNKNLDRIIEALTNISCSVNIIGTPTEQQVYKLKQKLYRYNIEFGISDHELANRYVSTDIVLFPSLYEGFGLPIIEGFKAGRVVVTSNISPMKEIACGAACLVDPTNVDSIKNGVLNVIHNTKYRESLINKGFEVVRQYEPEKIAEKYYELYKKVSFELCVA